MGNLGVTLSPSVSIWYEKAPRQGASASIFHGLKPALRRADKTGIMHLRDVAGIWKISWAFGLSFLLGCTGPIDPSVEFLSFGMPALKSSAPSPFDQEFELGQHVIFAGECTNSISSLEVRINDLAWVAVPTTAASPVTGVGTNGRSYSETMPSDPGYDVDCSDGRFRFYLYAHQIDDALLSLGRSESVQDEGFIQKISLRGLNGPFTTEPLVFSQGGSDSSAPEANSFNFHLSAYQIGKGLCVPLHIYLMNGDNNHVSNSKERELSLQKSGFSTPSDFRFYTDSACSQLIPETSFESRVVIPAGSTHLTVYLKGLSEEYPGAMGWANIRTIFLQAERNFPPGTPSNSRDLEIRDAGVVTEIRFMDPIRQTSVGRCEEIDIHATDAGGVLSNLLPGGTDLIVTPSTLFTGRVRFVQSCAQRNTTVSQIVFRANQDSSRRLAYVVEQQDEETISLSAPAVTFVGDPHRVNPWTAAHSLEIVDNWEALQIPVMAPDCRPLTLQMKTSSGLPAASSTAIEPINISIRIRDSTGAIFSFNSDCSSGVPAENDLMLTFAPGETSKTLYWQQTDNGYYFHRFVRSWSPRFKDPWKGLELSLAPQRNLFAALQMIGAPLAPDWKAIWRLPRGSSQAGPGPSSLSPLLGSDTPGAWLNRVGDANGAGVQYLGVQADRRIQQNVLSLDGSAGYQINSLFGGERTSGYVFFRFTGNGGDRVLVSFVESVFMMNLVVTSWGGLGFGGSFPCTLTPTAPVNLRDGNWHLVQFSLTNNSGTLTLQTRIDDHSLQVCTAAAGGLGGLLGSVTFGYPGLSSATPGLVGEIAEMGLTYHDFLAGTFSEYEVPNYIQQRYPFVSPP